MRTTGHHRLFPILLILALAVTARVVVAQDSVEQLFQQGNAAETAGKSDRAEEIWRKVLKIEPKNAKAYYNLGNALYGQKKFDQAIAAYQKAIQLNPNDASGYVGLGNALDDQKKFDQAIVAYQKAIQLDPKYASAYYNLGIFFFRQKKFNQAIVAYQKVLQLPNDYSVSSYPSNYAGSYNGLGLIFQEQLKLEEAIKYFDLAEESSNYEYAEASNNNIEARRLLLEQYNRLNRVENDRQWLPLEDPNLKIKRSIVQITSKFSIRERQGYDRGTGIVIERSNNRTLILTARHVVFEGNEQGENIQVEFFSSPPSNRVRMRRDANPLLNTIGDKLVDLVVLEVKGQLPDDIQPIAMSQLTNVTDRSIQIIGHFARRGKDLPWSVKSGKIKGIDDNQKLVISKANLKQGFSGAPLLDERNSLLGIAIEIRGDKQEDYAYPISTIKKQLSTWKISLKP
jgi:Flp pilus assembly protein TadD